MSFQKYTFSQFRGRLAPEAADRAWFAALLWRAFPSASENELSERAGPVLGLSPRQVRNLLQCKHDASWPVMLKALTIAGGEVVFRAMDPRK
jgi:hypothetical protein